MNKLSAVKTTGGCMRPLMMSGDMIFFEPGKLPSAGDVILFKKSGRVFAHRVLSVVGTRGYITVDDAGVTEPLFASVDSLVGRCYVFPSGVLGIVWCIFSRFFFKVCRRLKNISRTVIHKFLL